MDYEEKYKEALTRARSMYESRDDAELAAYIFPELTESEDERIINAILSFLRMTALYSSNGCKKPEMIAWLEKQKPVEYLSKQRVFAIMKKLTNLSQSNLIPLDSKEFDEINGITSDVRSLLDYPIEQKPSWSEEDKKVIEAACALLCEYAGYYKEKDMEAKNLQLFKVSQKLKSLRPQPKQEKSDYITPHKQFFKWIYDRLVSVHKENPDTDYMISFKKRIEELPLDEPSWKPSEEQMEALKYVNECVFLKDSRKMLGLKTLYEDLKKL